MTSILTATPSPSLGAEARPDTSLPTRPQTSCPGWVLRHARWILLAMTLVGGFLRFFDWHVDPATGHFTWLHRPVLWGDEGATFSRVTGDFADLLDILQFDGFPPLHYELYWWMGHGLPPFHFTSIGLGPFSMRLVTALAGTLMIPAIYFLARQLFARRVALGRPAFAACSAYLMVYSRDAKMYMPCWLFLTLHIGCLLWWLNTRLRVAWLAWIACGLAAFGLHASGLVVLAIEPLCLFLRWPDWRAFLLMVIGLAVVAAGPIGYYNGFNRWSERTGGIVPGAVEEDPDQQTSWAPSGIDWVPGYQADRDGSSLLLETFSAYLLSWEWPKDDRPVQLAGSPEGPIQAVIPPAIMAAAGVALAVFSAMLIMGMLPWPSYRPAVSRADSPRQPWWRGGFWLSVWIIVPAYFFYCRSMPEFTSPQTWIDYVTALWSGYWTWALGTMVAVAGCLLWWRPPIAMLAAVTAVVALGLLGICLLITPAGPYESAFRSAENIRQQGIRWLLAGALVVVVPLTWYFSGSTLARRCLSLLQLALTITIVLGLCFGVYRYFDGLREAFRIKTLDHDPHANWLSMWKAKWIPIWMPRYVGIIFPAFAVAAAALLMRLPTRPLRALAIILLLGVNLTNGMARVLADSEPPLDRMAADVWSGNDQQSAVRTFTNYVRLGAHPGCGALASHQGRYFLCIASGQRPKPQMIREEPVGKLGIRILSDISPRAIASEVRVSPQVQKVIVWQRLPRNVRPPPAENADPILRELGPGWQRALVENFAVRYHWWWADLQTCRRSEYIKQSRP